jgi:hypothetical protein
MVRRRNGKLLFTDDRVSMLVDEKVLKIDSSSGCTTLQR